MDIITTYLCGTLDIDIDIKFFEGFNMPKTFKSNPKQMYSIKLQRSFYGVKQFECMWYNHFSECLCKKGYTNDPIYLCVFIKKKGAKFCNYCRIY